MLGPMHCAVLPDAGAPPAHSVQAAQLLQAGQLGPAGKPPRYLQLLAAENQQAGLDQSLLGPLLCLQAQLAAWAGQLQASQAPGGGSAAGCVAADAAAEAAALAAATVVGESAPPAKRPCWQAPGGGRGRAFLRSISRTDSSAPGRREQLVDAALRLGSGDEGAGIGSNFLQEQLHAFSTPSVPGGQQEDGEGQRRLLSGLVGALLAGPGDSLFEEVYLPWLRGASPCRLAAEHSTFGCYLGMLRGGMDWRAVRRLMLGYLQGLLLRILQGSEDTAAERREQRRKRRRRCSARAAALRAAGDESESSMSQPGTTPAAACCWRDTASSCPSSDESDDTQP